MSSPTLCYLIENHLKNIFKLKKKKSTIGKESASNAGDPGLNSRWEDSLKKGMTTRFSILAWRISWTERSLSGYSLWACKELDTIEQLTQSS